LLLNRKDYVKGFFPLLLLFWFWKQFSCNERSSVREYSTISCIYDSHTLFPTTVSEDESASAIYGSHDDHRDDQNKDPLTLVLFSFDRLIMGNQASTIASAVGRWVGGIAAHLIALIIAPIVNRISQQPPPPRPSQTQQTPPPHPSQIQMDDLVNAVTGMRLELALLRVDLAARHEPFVYEMAIRTVARPRRGRGGHAGGE